MRVRSLLLPAVLAGLVSLSNAVAATKTWDVTTGDGAVITDGTGQWLSGNWNAAGTDGSWASGDVAVIGGGTLGSIGTITVSGSTTAGGITFNTPNAGGNYTVTDGTLTMANGSAVTVNAPGTTTIGSTLIVGGGGNSVTVGGSGNLTLGNQVGNGTQFQLVMSGSGTLTLGDGVTVVDNNNMGLTANSGVVIFNKANSGSGHAVGANMTLAGATVQLSGSGGDQIYDGMTMTVNSGTFDMNGLSEAVNGLNGSGGFVLNNAGTGTLTIGQSGGSSVYGGTLKDGSGVLAIIKAGGGETELQNPGNAHSGGTTATGGRLRATDRTLGTGGLTLQGGGTFFNVSGSGGGAGYYDNDFGKSVTLGAGGGGFRSGWGAMTISGTITGAGGLTIVNDGNITLSNTGNSYAGNTTIGASGSGNNATLWLGASEVIPNGVGKGNVTFNNPSAGVATLDLRGSSETINGLSSGGSGSLVVDNSTGSATLTVGDNNATSSFGGMIQNTSPGSLALIKIGSGELHLSSANTYSGGTTVSGGLLRATDNTIGTGGLTLQSGGVFFNVGTTAGGITPADTDFQKAVTLGAGGGGFRAGWGAMTISGGITGTGGLTIVNDGNITLSNTGNSYAGDTTIGASGSGNNATLYLGASQVIPSGAGRGNLVFNASGSGTATFDLRGFSETINGLTSGGAGANVVDCTTGAGTLTLGDGDASGTYAGTLRNSGGTLSLGKTGAGTQTLSGGSITYTGATTINGGTLVVSNTATAFDSASITVGTGATLEFAAGSTVQLNNNGQTLTGAGRMVKSGAGELQFGANGQNIYVSFSPGALIDVQAGTFRNEYSAGVWTANNASMNINGGATFYLWDANTMIDALTGAGTVDKGQNNTHTLTVGVANGSGTFSGTLRNATGAINLTKSGSGAQTLLGSGINYSGATAVSVGQLRYVDAINFYSRFSNTGTLTINSGATAEFSVSTSTGFSNDGMNQVLGTSGGGTSILGDGTFLKTGAGILGMGNGGGEHLYWKMSPGGTISIQAGTLRNGGWTGGVWTDGSTWTNRASLTIGASGIFDMWDGNPVYVDVLSGSGPIQRGNGSGGTLYIGTANGSGTHSGVVNSGIAITKLGSGTQTLSGYNSAGMTYTVNGGQLILGGTVDNNSGLGVVNSGATLVLAKASNTSSSGPHSLGGSSTILTINSGGIAQFAGSGTGQLYYQGGVVVNSGGVLDFNGQNEGWNTLNGGGTVLNNATATTSTMSLGQNNGSCNFSGVIADGSGTMALTVSGANATITLSGSSPNTFTGPTTCSMNYSSGQGQMALSKSANVAAIGSGGLTMTSNGSVYTTADNQFASGAVLTFTGPTGNPRFEFEGTTQTMAGIVETDNTVGIIENSDTTYGGYANAGTGTLALNGAGIYTYRGIIQNGNSTPATTGTLQLLKTGTGTQTLAGGSILYTGATTINGGTLVVSNSVTSFDSTNITVGTGATLEFCAAGANILLNNNGQTLTGAGRMTKTGTGELWFGASGQNINISFSPGAQIDVQAGVFRNDYSAGVWTANNASMNINSGATFYLWDANTTIDALTGAGTVDKGQNNTHTLTVGVANGSGTFGGTLRNATGAINLTKSGSGTQTLLGSAINYSGATTVTGGRLSYVDAINFYSRFSNTGTLTINSGATAEFSVSTSTGFGNDGMNQVLATSGGGTSILGDGTFLKSGAGILGMANGGGEHLYWKMSPGGTISVQAGTLRNGGWTGGVWTDGSTWTNRASLTIGPSGSVDLWDGAAVYVDGLNGSGPLTANPGGSGSQTIYVGAGNGDGSYSGVIQNAMRTVNVTKIGSGSQTLAGYNNSGMTYTVNGGTLTLGGTADNNSGVGVVNSGATLVLAKTSSSSAHALGSGLTVAGGTALLSGTGGDQIYDGIGVTVNSGLFDLNGLSETIKILSGSGGTVTNTGAGQSVLTINLTNPGTQTYNGIIGGNIRVQVLNANTKNTDVETFNGINTYTGGTVISNGHLRATSDTGLGAVPGVFDASNIVIMAGGVLQNNNSTLVLDANRGLYLGAGGGVFYAGWGMPVTINGVISGPGTLTKTDGGTLNLAAANTFTGNTMIYQSTVTLVHSSGLQNSTLDYNSYGGSVNFGTLTSATLGGLQGNQALALQNASSAAVALSVGNNNQTTTYSGASSGGGSLIKIGTGTLTLTGSVGYTGATTVNGGTLRVSGQQYLNLARTTTIAADAVLDLYNSANTFTTLMPVSTVTGSGTFRLSGNSTINQSTGGSTGTRLTFSMTGGTIDLQDTARLTNGGWQELYWANNKASMNIASGAVLDMWDGNAVSIDALTGYGTVTKGMGGSSMNLNVGVNNGSGTFSGTLNAANGGYSYTLIKSGSGTQTLAGTTDNISLAATVSAGTLVLGKDNSAAAHAVGSGLTVAGGTALLSGTGGDQIYDGTWVAVNSGTFDLNGLSETIKYLNGSGGTVTNNGAGQSVLTINLTNPGTQVYSGSIGGNLRVQVLNSNSKNADVEAFAANNTYSGGTLVSNGHLRVTSDAGLGILPGTFDPSNVVLMAGGVLQNNDSSPVLHANRGIYLGSGGGVIYAGWSGNGRTLTINGVISGPGGLTKMDGSPLILNGASTYSGDTTITEGTLRLGTANVIPDGTGKGNVIANSTLDLNALSETINGLSGGGTVSGGGALTLGGGDASASFSGTLSSALTLTKIGSGTQTLIGGLIDYTGTTTIGGGTLLLSNLDDLLSAGTFTISNAASLVISTTSRDFQFVRPITVVGGGTLAKTGSSYSAFIGANNQGVTMAMAAGSLIDVRQGTLRNEYGSFNNWSANQSSLSVSNGATFNIWDANTVVDVLRGSGSVDANYAGYGLTIGAAGGSGTFDGVIKNTAGTLTLTKTGAGTQTLTGTNTYSGATVINGGALLVNGAKTGGGTVTVNSGGALGGTGTVAGQVALNSGGHLAPGASPGTITLSGGIALNDGAILDFELQDGGPSDLIVVSGGTVTGAASAEGVTVNITLSGAPLAQGTVYTLMDWTLAGESGVESSDFRATLPPGVSGLPHVFVSGKKLLLGVNTSSVFLFK